MTGTGTQSDPFVPGTLTEFIEAVGTSGAYVALDRDIDAAEDPNYGGELTNYIQWHCTEVNGNDHALIGLTIRGSSVFSAFRVVNVRNMIFRDLASVATDNSRIIFSHDGGSGKYFVLTDCSISLKASSFGYHPIISVDSYITRCAFDISYSGYGGNDDRIFDNCELRETMVRISGYTAPALTMAIRCPGMVRSAFILDNCAVSPSIVTYPKSTPQYSYVAARQSADGHRITAGNSGAGCIIATDGSISATLASGWTRATLAQMRDEAWLTSVGFLP